MENNNEQQPQQQQLQIELTPEKAQGIYANLAFTSHTHSEFVLDFISALAGLPKAQVVSRVILAPENAKRLALVLQDSIAHYEQEFGKIDLGQPQPQQPAGPRVANPFEGQGEA